MDAAIAGLIGVVIGAVPGVITFWLGKRSEERQQIRQLTVQAALESWKSHSEASQRLGGSVMPLEVYLISAFKLAEMADAKPMDATNARQRIRELIAVIELVEAEVKEYNKRKEQKRNA